MSRFGDTDYESDYPELDYGRWEHNLRRAITGRSGQKVLREMRDALLTLPSHRLIRGELATPDGEVCAVGCLIAYKRAMAKGTSVSEEAAMLAEDDPYPLSRYHLSAADGEYVRIIERPAGKWTAEDGWVQTGVRTEERLREDDRAGESAEYTARKGQEAGLVYTLAWHIGWLNDEAWFDATPEQRWQRCLDWLDRKIAAAAA